jgi:ribosome-associated protein
VGDDTMLEVNDSVRVPRAELTYRATRSGGPGGQHVNTSSTRVELAWNVDASPSVSDEERARIREKLSNRISGEGLLLLSASEHRSQNRNKEAVTERFVELLRQALVVQAKRKKTRPGKAAREARLHAKKHRSEVKRRRRSLED